MSNYKIVTDWDGEKVLDFIDVGISNNEPNKSNNYVKNGMGVFYWFIFIFFIIICAYFTNYKELYNKFRYSYDKEDISHYIEISDIDDN